MEPAAARIVIVGGGQAGARAAASMREAGFRGSVVLVAEEPHLPYERPALSKALLSGAQTSPHLVLEAPSYDQLEIDLLRGERATAIDRAGKSVRLTSGADFSYDRLLLATGSRVRRPEVRGLDPDAVFVLRTLDESVRMAEALSHHPDVAVIGGGFIGLEVAATAAAMGCRVTVLEAADRLLPRLGCHEASSYVLRAHTEMGIRIHLGACIDHARGGLLHLLSGEQVRADVVVAGVGVLPDVALARDAGLEVRDGIVVDETGRSSDPFIFAAGDVAHQFHPLLGRHVRLESWHNANVHGESVGRNIVGIPSRPAEAPWVWSDQGPLNLQFAGAPIRVDHTVIRGETQGKDGFSLFQFADGRLVGGVTVNRGKDMPLIRRALAGAPAGLNFSALGNPDVSLRRILAGHETA